MKSLQIKSVEINKFRSLKKIKCDFADISVFVGRNDAGKSNILKALNLFFNGELESGKKLNFNDDFNYGSHAKKKADEISIKVTFSLPSSYLKNGKYLVWEKKWRTDGEVRFERETDYFYGLSEDGKKLKIAAKANVRSLLDRINYIYVPAVRDPNYFDILRVRIYNTMTKVAEQSLENASGAFENYMSKHLKDLVDATKNRLSENIVMSFPKNLANIFEKLDFLSGEKHVSLNKRGDGIKNRYIPLILNFIAVHEKKLTGKGAAPYTFIWGYEEPENNMEIKNCIDLRDEFISYIKDSSIAQILLTTHSPVFYNIKDKSENDLSTIVWHVQRNSSEDTNLIANSNDIDVDMGTAAMLSDEYKKLESKLEYVKKQKKNVEEILEQNKKPCLFVEGSTDKIVLERLFDVYQIKRDFLIISDNDGCGEHYVIDMLSAWDLSQKYQKSQYKAAGLVDEDAKSHAQDFNSHKNQNNLTKCFILPSSKRLIEWKGKNLYNICSYLETFYTEELWTRAEKLGWLLAKDNTDVLNETAKKKCINENVKLETLLENLPLFITHKINRYKKKKFAEFVCKINNEELAKCFIDIKSTLENISEYLSCENTKK